MSEKEPAIGINLGDTRFEMTRRNTFLYTFMGRAALYNHVFLKRDDLPQTDDGNIVGTYIFQGLTPNQEVWNRLENTLKENDYPQYLNHAEPSDGDIRAYIQTATSDLEKQSGLPEGWE
jgi:hypothetical protein